MEFEESVRQADEKITREHRESVVREYTPLFRNVKDAALKHLRDTHREAIKLNITHTGLHFRQDGFYEVSANLGEVVRKRELSQLPAIYQGEADYITGQADARVYTTPSYHDAMRSALTDFRSAVKKSLADVI